MVRSLIYAEKLVDSFEMWTLYEKAYCWLILRKGAVHHQANSHLLQSLVSVRFGHDSKAC